MSNSETSNVYTLTLHELNNIQTVIKIQNILGKGMPVLTRDSNVEFIKLIGGSANFGEFMWNMSPKLSNGLLLDFKKTFKNSEVVNWLNALSNAIISFKTSFNNKQENYTNLFLSYAYGQYATAATQLTRKTVPQLWKGFTKGTTIRQFDSDPFQHSDTSEPTNVTVSRYPLPHIPDDGNAANDWASSLNNSFGKIKSNPPSSIFETSGSNFGKFVSAQTSTIDPENWKNNEDFKAGVSPMWTSQMESLKKLQSLQLGIDHCTFLLYLLICLGTGDTQQQSEVAKIANASCTSREKPNSTFANTLAYLFSMILVNPFGNYGQNHDQIQGILKSIVKLIVSSDPGSQAIKTALNSELKMLNASSGYPMTDPFNAGTNFNTRESDVLAALNQTWSKLFN